MDSIPPLFDLAERSGQYQGHTVIDGVDGGLDSKQTAWGSGVQP